MKNKIYLIRAHLNAYEIFVLFFFKLYCSVFIQSMVYTHFFFSHCHGKVGEDREMENP